MQKLESPETMNPSEDFFLMDSWGLGVFLKEKRYLVRKTVSYFVLRFQSKIRLYLFGFFTTKMQKVSTSKYHNLALIYPLSKILLFP